MTALEGFIRFELNDDVRDEILDGISKHREEYSKWPLELEFNRYILTIDLESSTVLVQDDLDVSEVGRVLVDLEQFIDEISDSATE